MKQTKSYPAKKILPCLSIFLGVTDRCNLNCKHCYSIKQNISNNSLEISLKEVKNIANALQSMGTFSVQLSGGEPFLRKDFLKICKVFSDKGIYLYINTNGLLLDKERLTYLNKLKVTSFQISLDSINKATLEHMRGAQDITKTLMKNIILSKSILGDKLCLGCVITSYNYSEIEDVIKFANKHSIKLVLIPLLTTGRANKEIDLTLKKKMNLFKKCKKYKNVTLVAPPVFNYLAGVKSIYSYCSFPYHMAIMPDGDVYPCSGLRHIKKLKVGNIYSSDFKHLFTRVSSLFKTKYPIQLKGLCNRCIFKNSCMGGCRASAFVNNDSFENADPLCEELFRLNKFPKECLMS